MSDRSFTTTISVTQPPHVALEAIRNVRGWWSEGIEGATGSAGDEFTYRYGDVHHCTVRVTDVVPDRKVSWLVLSNYFNFVEDETEWKDTTITFELTEREGGTEVRFTHHGLVPAYECFDACSDGWTFYIASSLRNLIETGEGQPNGPEEVRTAAEAVAIRHGR
jgi:uncharacterized protein YndB with AHSA1/START domain